MKFRMYIIVGQVNSRHILTDIGSGFHLTHIV
jgi:hypothetical protein